MIKLIALAVIGAMLTGCSISRERMNAQVISTTEEGLIMKFDQDYKPKLVFGYVATDILQTAEQKTAKVDRDYNNVSIIQAEGNVKRTVEIKNK